nr:GNAT family N-acetyltransferase [Rufibacter sp. LB8]
MHLQEITSTATPEFLWAWQLYEEAFPAEERRSLNQQEALLATDDYQFLAVHTEIGLAGLVGIWHLEEFTFLEHVAVSPSQRGAGIGQNLLALLKIQFPGKWVLEVEPPLNVLSQRRIAFYQRAGFVLNDFPYQQPPYSPEKSWVPLQLMSFPGALTSNECQQVVTALYHEVYQVAP